jgi:uncharacterized protein
MLIYLDASAIVKLVRSEPETPSLFAFLREWPERVTSVVSAVEVPRAVRRASRSARDRERAESVVARLGLVELDASVRARAAGLGPTGLRTLDAIHLATALDLSEDLGSFVTYDQRQGDAARRAGIVVYSPAT